MLQVTGLCSSQVHGGLHWATSFASTTCSHKTLGSCSHSRMQCAGCCVGQAERPVIVHRAILGSVERMFAILTENFAGKWPFWISPRQVMVVPIAEAHNE